MREIIYSYLSRTEELWFNTIVFYFYFLDFSCHTGFYYPYGQYYSYWWSNLLGNWVQCFQSVWASPNVRHRLLGSCIYLLSKDFDVIKEKWSAYGFWKDICTSKVLLIEQKFTTLTFRMNMTTSNRHKADTIFTREIVLEFMVKVHHARKTYRKVSRILVMQNQWPDDWAWVKKIYQLIMRIE